MPSYIMVKHAPSSAPLSTVAEPVQLKSGKTTSTDSLLMRKDCNGLKVHMDKSSNLCHEPTDDEIRKQIKRWKTELNLEKGKRVAA